MFQIKVQKMRIYKKISGLLFTLLLASSVSAQDIDCNFKKSYFATKGTCISISNKYGNINVISSDKDSAYICATISINQGNEELLKKSVNLIDVKFDKTDDTIKVVTTFDKRFFSSPLRDGRKSFRVDYIITMPKTTGLIIVNEFGNITLDELSGPVFIRLSQGVLTAKKLSRDNIKPISMITADNAKIMIDDINWLNMKVWNCPSVILGQAKALLVTSSFTKIRIENISSLVTTSKSDNYNIGSIKNLVSVSSYSSFNIGELTGQLRSSPTFGSITVDLLNPEFSLIDLDAKHTIIDLTINDMISFRTDIVATGSTIDFPLDSFPDITKSTSNNTTTFVGRAGTDRSTESLIRIRQDFGKLLIH